MKIFNKISNALNYWASSLSFSYSKTNINNFEFDELSQKIIVFYRVGNTRLLNYKSIYDFENKHFDRCSNYDRNRLTKFSTLQRVLNEIAQANSGFRKNLNGFIKKEIKNDQLF